MDLHLSAPVALGFIVMFAMAYAEGSNDISKVVATLVGSGVTNYRGAIVYGASLTAIGALAGVVLGQGVAVTLTKGLVTPAAPVNETFALAALAGAMIWILLATRAAMPISSSHAIVGSIIILGALVFGIDQVRWDSVWARVILPMAASPLIAVPIALLLSIVLKPLSRRISLASGHWLSAGLASFGRGVNDAPKIAALGVFFFLTGEQSWSGVPVLLLFAIVALGMTAGSLVAGWRVTETLAERVAPMDHASGLAANATTAFLSLTASGLGLPISMTHVISFSIIGIGMQSAIRQVSWRTVRRMVFAWLVTLPATGAFACASYLFMSAFS